jgi:plastocyanin
MFISSGRETTILPRERQPQRRIRNVSSRSQPGTEPGNKIVSRSVVSSEMQFHQRKYSLNKLRISFIGLPLFFLALPTMIVQADRDAGASMQRVHEIQVTLRKYEFTPGSLHVKKGERVRLVMAAVDHDHGFKLNEFDINQKVQKGTTVVAEFTADKSGTFQFRCSSVCGLGHRGMKGTLVVEE